jgi:FixJ family two-component response regulator
MKGMSGLDLQRHLLNQGHHVPIVFITAYPDEVHRERAFSAGAICFLSKPFDEQSLIDCLTLIVDLGHKNYGSDAARVRRTTRRGH